MTDPRNPLAALPAVDPSDAAALEARHEVIVELIGAYADGELPAETVAQLDAHLVGCTSCRRELAVHDAVRRRLAAEPPAAASPALRARIAGAIAAVPPPARAATVAARRPASPAARLAAALGLVALLGAGVFVAWPRQHEPVAAERLRTLTGPPASDALLAAVLDDYRRVTARDLPGRARDVDAVRAAVPFPVEPLGGDDLRLLAAWTADLRGEQAAVLAYRWDDHVIVQYLVSDAHFFRSAAVRSGVAAGYLLAAHDGPVTVVAWPLPSAGSVLVGDLPAERLAELRSAQRVAKPPAGGAH